MKRMFAAVTSFFRRLRVAWKVSREPNALEAIQHFKTVTVKEREQSRFLSSLVGMRNVARSLVSSGHFDNIVHKDRDKSFVILTIKPKRIMTSREADEVLSESRVAFTLPRDGATFKRLAEHEDKLRAKAKKGLGNHFRSRRHGN